MNQTPSRRWWQFSLRTILLFAVPWVAALAWVVALDGPYFDNRRVLTHKLGLIGLLVNAAFFITLVRLYTGPHRRFLHGWVLGWLLVLAIVAGTIFRNRQQSLERQKPHIVPAPTVNATDPTPH
ncbi:MAG: hypothetical protein WD845_10810 [Pirellulales bacterium]